MGAAAARGAAVGGAKVTFFLATTDLGFGAGGAALLEACRLCSVGCLNGMGWEELLILGCSLGCSGFTTGMLDELCLACNVGAGIRTGTSRVITLVFCFLILRSASRCRISRSCRM